MARLPLEYQEIQYLESTGKQYIATGVTHSSAIYWESKFSVTRLKGSQTNNYNIIVGNSGYPQMAVYDGGWTIGNVGSTNPYVPIIDQIYIGTINKNGSNNSYYIDGENTGLTRSGNNPNLHIFSTYDTGTYARIYYVIFASVSTNEILHHYIPCYRKSDNTPGMYDLITDTFLTNAGTGTFVLGPNIEPKASANITLFHVIDIDSTTIYYLLQSSTANPPAKPTTDNPGGNWTTTEPTYTEGSTNTLYTVTKTKFSDGTFEYTPVSKSSSYEAAKSAYNKAVNAQNTANNVNNYISNIDIANQNLLFNYQKPLPDSSQWSSAPTEVITSELPQNNEIAFALRGLITTSYYVPYDITKKYKISCWYKTKASSASSTDYYYPSIFPFDMDKNQIGYSNVTYYDSTITTLSADLNPGDTIVHLTDVSTWSRSSGITTNAIKYVGIFNYKSQSGYAYNDYTRNTYKFANSGEDMTQFIDYDNNTITLKSAYNGQIVPAGTKVAFTCEGSTYIYPFGGIKKNQTADWVYKEKIFDSTYDRRLPSTSYIKFSPTIWVNDVYFYNPKLIDYDLNDKILKTVKQVDVEYYLSASSTELSGGSWSTTAPTWVNGKYMWSRQKVTYVDGTTATRNQTCIAGAKGETGNTGTGIDSITEEYYLSTSKTSQTGGSWVTTPPTWSNSKYIWTRSKIIYKNPSSTVYTTPICSSEWEAVNNIKVGGRNYISNLSKNWESGHWSYQTGLPETYVSRIRLKNPIEVTPGSTLAISVYQNDTVMRYLGIRTYGEDDTYIGSQTNIYDQFLYKIPNNVYKIRCFIYDNSQSTSILDDEKIKIKIEFGNTFTDYTPAPEDSNNVISGTSAPSDTTAIWFNTSNNMFYQYNGESWEPINDYGEDISNLQTAIGGMSTAIDNKIAAYDEEIQRTYYTKTEVDSEIQSNAAGIREVYNGRITTLEDSNTGLIQRVTSIEGYIQKGVDANGPYVELGTPESPYKLRITNDSINITHMGQIVSNWKQDLIELNTVITSYLNLGNFSFIINSDDSISFRKIR